MAYASHRVAQRRTLRWAQGSVCAGCGKHLPSARRTKKHHPDYPTFDHVIPLSRGGKNRLTNGLLKHRICNAARGNRSASGCDLIWLAFVQARLSVRPKSVKNMPGWQPPSRRSRSPARSLPPKA